jgi:hypothetical protein
MRLDLAEKRLKGEVDVSERIEQVIGEFRHAEVPHAFLPAHDRLRTSWGRRSVGTKHGDGCRESDR